jgi:hypothetical protein
MRDPCAARRRCRRADAEAHRDGGDGELNRCRQPPEQRGEDGLRSGARITPVTAQKVGSVICVLDRQRLVEVQFLSQALQRVLADRQARSNVGRERVDPWHAAQQHEHDDADANED